MNKAFTPIKQNILSFNRIIDLMDANMEKSKVGITA